MAAFESSESFHLFTQVGFDTDIGGGRENQDDWLVWQQKKSGLSVFGVLDGHGREVGKIAANAAKASIFRFCEEGCALLQSSPVDWLINAHKLAHDAIKQSFKVELEGQGFEIFEDPEGYLLKRKNNSQSWSCVHGGSSCSLVAIVGSKMYIANVGDSSGTLCASSSVLKTSMLEHIVDAALPPTSSLVENRKIWKEVDPLNDTITITAEHSPECPYEFLRLREYRARDGDPSEPALMVVYDAPSFEKARCNPVFEIDSSGIPCVTGRGR